MDPDDLPIFIDLSLTSYNLCMSWSPMNFGIDHFFAQMNHFLLLNFDVENSE